MTSNPYNADHRNQPASSVGSLPIAHPFGSGPLPASAPVRRTSGESRGTNTSRSSHSKSPLPRGAGPVGAKHLEAIASNLSERDLAILRRVAEHRYLTTAHLQDFCFTGHGSDDAAATTTRRVLRRLGQLGLIRRLTRRVGGVRAGSGATVWQLAPAGARIIRHAADGFRTHEPSPRFLGHCLAMADAHLQLGHLHGRPGVLSVAVQVEPLAWRSFLGPGGERRTLQPDLYTELVTSEYEDRWFIEVDQGTESLNTLLRKCQAYEAYRATGSEQARHGVFPRVLWIMGGTRGNERADRLRATIERGGQHGSLTPALYVSCTPEGVLDVIGGGV